MTHEALPTPPTPELSIGQRLVRLGRVVLAQLNEINPNIGETGLRGQGLAQARQDHQRQQHEQTNRTI